MITYPVSSTFKLCGIVNRWTISPILMLIKKKKKKKKEEKKGGRGSSHSVEVTGFGLDSKL